MEIIELTRVFKYNSLDLADPGPAMSAEQVRDFYANLYPEIVSAAIEGPEQRDDKLVYTFRRAVGTKGGFTNEVHLHEVLEQYEQGFPLAIPGVSKAARLDIRDPKSSICFHMGIDNKLLDSKPTAIPALVKLPFPECWFEINFRTADQDIFPAGVLAQRSMKEDGVIDGFCLYKARNVGSWVYAGRFQIRPEANENRVERASEYADYLCEITAVFLTALNCHRGVSKVEHVPPKALQDKRLNNGKKPLFSYWTLHLDLGGPTARKTMMGGTHASPRLHLRRAHVRQYKPGEYTWVQEAIVGSPHGMVHKDYAVQAC